MRKPWRLCRRCAILLVALEIFSKMTEVTISAGQNTGRTDADPDKRLLHQRHLPGADDPAGAQPVEVDAAG